MTDDDPWPPHVLASNQPPRQWNARSDAPWEAIRQAYLDGVPARDLCDRYEVALSTLRLKAKEGGWRRADQPDSDLFAADADEWADQADAGSDAGEEDWTALAASARFRLRRAIAAGRAAEAASWLRVYDRLGALAGAERVRERSPEADATPDRVATTAAVAAQIESLARRASRARDDVEMAAIEVELAALEAHAGASAAASVAPTLGALDPLDPVFPSADDDADAATGLSP